MRSSQHFNKITRKQLSKAILNDDIETVEIYTQMGGDVNVRTTGLKETFNNILLMTLAAKVGHLEIVKHLFKTGANPTAKNNSAILAAAKNGRLDVVQFLVGLKDHQGNLLCNPAARNNALIGMAAKNGHLDVVKFLVGLKDNQGNLLCNPAARDNAPLGMAAKNGHLDVVQFLIALKDNQGNLLCNPAARNNEPINLAALNGHLNVVKFLVRYKDNQGKPLCNPTYHIDSFFWAALHGHLDVVRFLIGLKDNQGNLVCNPTVQNNAPIRAAAMTGSHDMVFFLWDNLKLEDRIVAINLCPDISKIIEKRINNAKHNALLFSHMLDGYYSNGNDFDFPPLIAAKITDFRAQLDGETNLQVIDSILAKGFKPKKVNKRKRTPEPLNFSEIDVATCNHEVPRKKQRKR